MSEINESCDISVLIFFDFWRSSLNAKSITQFCKKHFTQLIKLTDIFNLINILINCFNATWSKISLTSRSRQISVFSQLFVICASCTKFSTASIADLCFLFLISISHLIKIQMHACICSVITHRAVTTLYSHVKLIYNIRFFLYFFIKCMQSMTMTLSRRCMYAKLHVLWSKSLLYIFSLINHIDSLRIQALFLNSRHRTFIFLCFFALLTFYSFVSNNHFLVAIQVFFKYSSVAILSILMMNSVNIVFVFLSWVFSLSFICSAL